MLLRTARLWQRQRKGCCWMSIKGVIGTALDTTIKIILIAVMISYTYKYAMQAYEFGYRIFAEKPVSTEETAKAISISVAEEATVMEIGTVLEEKGMIGDARLFFVQELLLGYHGKIKPGIYELSSDMTAREMLAAMSAETAEPEDDTGKQKAAAEGNGQEETEGETEAEDGESGLEGEAEPEDGEPEAEGEAEPEDGESGAE